VNGHVAAPFFVRAHNFLDSLHHHLGLFTHLETITRLDSGLDSFVACGFYFAHYPAGIANV
jgi:hypothetical protein